MDRSVGRARLGLAALLLALAGCWAPPSSAPAAPADPSAAPGDGSVSVHVSSEAGDRLAAGPAPPFGPGAADQGRPPFSLDDSVRFQRIDGFGASLLEAGLVTLDTLPGGAEQDAVLRALFDPRQGAGFSVAKTPIGATDFQSASQDWFTYDDTPGDVALRHFSIARDLGPHGVATYVKRARAAGGRFLLQAPMDYPPDWMLDADQNVQRKYYQTLADYFVRYVREYERQGIHVDYLSPFNEPGGYTKMSMSDIRDFIRDYLGPTFARLGITTHIQLSEVGRRIDAATGYPTVLDDARARRYVATLPYHGYDWNSYDELAGLHRRYPGIPMWMTELCCLNTQEKAADFGSGDGYANAIISDLEAGASSWIYWNAILDRSGGPWLVSPVHGDPEQNAQESVVVVDRDRHTVTYTGLYYYLAHFSKFVRPGATRIQTNAAVPDGLRAVAFVNGDGSVVAELLNSGGDAADVQLDWRGRSLGLTLPAVSITTLQWHG